MILEDGQGTGKKAGINGRNEVKTFSITESEAQASTFLGDAYNINSGDVTGLTAGDATLLYLKNDEDYDIIIEAVAIGLRGFTGLTDMAQITLIQNPTAGDIITDATPVSMNANRNFGSSKTLKNTTLTYKGKAAGTITGGNDAIYFYSGNNSRLFANIGIELPRGSSLAIKVESDATAGTAYAALVAFVKDGIR
jgi:hypothetical protein